MYWIPGIWDFYFEVIAASRVVDTMVMVLSATAGVEVRLSNLGDFRTFLKWVVNRMDGKMLIFKSCRDMRPSCGSIVRFNSDRRCGYF
jgi:hypothetical protein